MLECLNCCAWSQNTTLLLMPPFFSFGCMSNRLVELPSLSRYSYVTEYVTGSHFYSRKPHTRPTQAHYMYNTVHGCHSGLNTLPTLVHKQSTHLQTTQLQLVPCPLPKRSTTPYSQEHQAPASQETQKFPASSLPTPSQQQHAENIAAQSTPPRRRCRLQSQAIRNVSTNSLAHSQANLLDSQANTDVTPLNMSQPKNGRPAKRVARDRISASSQPKRKR